MSKTRQRRIIKRVVVGLTISVVLLCVYVSAFWAAAWFDGSQYGGQPVIRNAALFGPLHAYRASRAPGSLEFSATEMYFVNGGRFPMSMTYEVAKELRQAGRL